jgi:hypothetical protein
MDKDDVISDTLGRVEKTAESTTATLQRQDPLCNVHTLLPQLLLGDGNEEACQVTGKKLLLAKSLSCNIAIPDEDGET